MKLINNIKEIVNSNKDRAGRYPTKEEINARYLEYLMNEADKVSVNPCPFKLS